LDGGRLIDFGVSYLDLIDLLTEVCLAKTAFCGCQRMACGAAGKRRRYAVGNVPQYGKTAT
jgi:hypothetical protein